MLSCHKVTVLQTMTTSMPTVSVVGNLKAERGGELTKVIPQENMSLIFQPGSPHILPRAPALTGGTLSTTSTSFFPSSLQPQQPGTPNSGSRCCGRGDSMDYYWFVPVRCRIQKGLRKINNAGLPLTSSVTWGIFPEQSP